MKKALLPLLLIYIFGCSGKLDNWVTFKDKFNIGSIQMPTIPNEKLDTSITSRFKLVSSINTSSLDNKKNSPSTFNYNLFFPTEISEFDFLKIKQDSNTTNQLLENMIKGAQDNSNSEVIEKSYFKYPEPSAKVTLLNKKTNTIGVCRLIIFDNYIIVTCATGSKDEFSNNIEEEFFKTLNINSENRNRK